MLIVRVHGGAYDAGSSTAKITVGLYPTAPSREDPSQNFVLSSTAMASVEVKKGNVDAAPTFLRDSLTSGFGSRLALIVTGTQESTAMTDFNADISVELELKAS